MPQMNFDRSDDNLLRAANAMVTSAHYFNKSTISHVTFDESEAEGRM